MKLQSTAILTLMLTACGSNGGSAVQEEAGAVQDSDITLSSDKAPANAAGESVVSPSLGSIALSDASQLPECSTENETQLAYVIADSAFVYCASGEWKPIDIKGKDGKDGKDGSQGIAGEKGEKGDTGAQGIAGKDGAQGEQGIQGERGETGFGGLKPEWTDTVTGKTWRFHGFVIPGYVKSACSAVGNHDLVKDFRLPTLEEAQEALRNGLKSMNGPLDFWIERPDPSRPLAYIDAKGEVPAQRELVIGTSEYHGIYCIGN